MLVRIALPHRERRLWEVDFPAEKTRR